MKAIVLIGGKQYIVNEKDELYVEKLDAKEGDKVVFDKVLMVSDKLGHPYVKGAKVEAKVLKHGKQKKIIIFKFKPKKQHHKKQGHRQPYTKIQITKISDK